jgi:hypothetical protein
VESGKRLNVTNAACHTRDLSAECRYTEYHYAECRHAEYCYAECSGASLLTSQILD